MNTADVLRRKRAKLVGQIEFIDELLAEMGGVEDSAPPSPEPVHRPTLTPPNLSTGRRSPRQRNRRRWKR